MTNTVERGISLTIPFPSAESAALVYDILNVDKELKGSGVERKLDTDGGNLIVNFHGADLKKIRVSVNSVFKNILLITKTLELFGGKYSES